MAKAKCYECGRKCIYKCGSCGHYFCGDCLEDHDCQKKVSNKPQCACGAVAIMTLGGGVYSCHKCYMAHAPEVVELRKLCAELYAALEAQGSEIIHLTGSLADATVQVMEKYGEYFDDD